MRKQKKEADWQPVEYVITVPEPDRNLEINVQNPKRRVRQKKQAQSGVQQAWHDE